MFVTSDTVFMSINNNVSFVRHISTFGTYDIMVRVSHRTIFYILRYIIMDAFGVHTIKLA